MQKSEKIMKNLGTIKKQNKEKEEENEETKERKEKNQTKIDIAKIII